MPCKLKLNNLFLYAHYIGYVHAEKDCLALVIRNCHTFAALKHTKAGLSYETSWEINVLFVSFENLPLTKIGNVKCLVYFSIYHDFRYIFLSKIS